jgi:carbon-monoxide dehydrogenase medium subunit
MNTRLLTREYDYISPATLAEALEVLSAKQNVRILAGGTDLIVKLKTGADLEMDYMLDIKRIAELDYIRMDDDGLRIGALAKLSAIEKFPAVCKHYPALHEALQAMAAIAVRNMGTMAGNLCNASPVADTAGPAICYDAKLVLAGKQGKREVPVTEFFIGLGKSMLAKDEILTEIFLPKPKAFTGSAFCKKTRVTADIAKISATALFAREGQKVSACRIAMGAIAVTPLYLKDISESLIGREINKAVIAEAAAAAAAVIKPIDDNHSTAEYRKEIAALIVEEVLTKAWQRAGGEL